MVSGLIPSCGKMRFLIGAYLAVLLQLAHLGDPGELHFGLGVISIWSSRYRFQFNIEALYLHTSIQPVEPQTRVKSERNAFFLPDFQFIFNLTVLQPNKPNFSLVLSQPFPYYYALYTPLRLIISKIL